MSGCFCLGKICKTVLAAMVIAVFMAASVSAVSFSTEKKQDGLTLGLSTNKKIYQDDEGIALTIALHNGNDFGMENIGVTFNPPAGMIIINQDAFEKVPQTLQPKTRAEAVVLAAFSDTLGTIAKAESENGESTGVYSPGTEAGSQLSTSTKPGSQLNSEINFPGSTQMGTAYKPIPNTRAGLSIWVWVAVVGVVAGAVTFAVSNKEKAIKLLSIVLFCGMFVAAAATIFYQASFITVTKGLGARSGFQESTKVLTVVHAVRVGGADYDLMITVSYRVEEEMSTGLTASTDKGSEEFTTKGTTKEGAATEPGAEEKSSTKADEPTGTSFKQTTSAPTNIGPTTGYPGGSGPPKPSGQTTPGQTTAGPTTGYPGGSGPPKTTRHP